MELFRELNEEPAWKSLEEAASRLAYFKAELNMLHSYIPFVSYLEYVYILTLHKHFIHIGICVFLYIRAFIQKLPC